MGLWYLRKNGDALCEKLAECLTAMGERLTEDPVAGEGVLWFPRAGESLIDSLVPVLERRQGGGVLVLIPYFLWEGDPQRAEDSQWAGGVCSAVRALARRFAPRLRINCLRYGCLHSDKPDESLLACVALGRGAKTEELARAALFFAGEGSSFMTGQSIDVNGGRRY